MPYNYGQIGPQAGQQPMPQSQNMNGFQQPMIYQTPVQVPMPQPVPQIQPQVQPQMQQQIPQVQMPDMNQMNQQQMPQQRNTFEYVGDIVEAKLWRLAPGEKVIMRDSNQPLEYRKTRDTSGKYLPLEIYQLVRVEEQPQQPQTQQMQPVQPIQNGPQIDLSEYVKVSDLGPIIDKMLNERLEAAVDKALSK